LDPSAYANGSPVSRCRYYERGRTPTLTDGSTDYIPLFRTPSGSTQTLRTPVLVLSHLMAPLPRSLKSSRLDTWSSWLLADNLVKILLLLIIISIAFKSYTVFSTRRHRMLVHQLLYQEKDSKPSLPIRQKEKTTQSCSKPDDPNQRLNALQQELSRPAFKPIHPWIAPPTPLPGPYDAPYYPLPSIRRVSQDSATESVPEEIQAISYVRRVSSSSSTSDDSSPILHGTITVSNHGWRRTQWTVSKG
jgi:hypothetical protein